MALARARLLTTIFSAHLALIAASSAPVRVGARITDKLDILWGQTQLLNGDRTIALSLDRAMGSGFRSKTSYVFARIDIDIKLVPKNSAGTVTTVYLISEKHWKRHDEIDLEFLGNVSGQPYTLHTNIFASGVGGREVQYRLWFDPTEDFHTYSIIWSSDQILILVDDVAIRQFKNHWVDAGVPFPVYQPMRFYGVLWDADDWATEGGLIKTDWSQAPFVAYFQNFRAQGCVPSGFSWVCDQDPFGNDGFSGGSEVDDTKQRRRQLTEARDKYMVYDYCTDSVRFPDGFPKECGLW